MNITKDFHEYLGIIKNTISTKYVLKTERYGVFDKCTRLLKQIEEVGKNLQTMTSMSKKSSPFNDIDFSTVTGEIKRSLTNLEEEIKKFELKEVKNNSSCSKHEQKTIENTVELLRTRLQNINLKFRKFLQKQSENIKNKIVRINNLTGAHINTLSGKKSHNEFIYTSVPNQDEDDELDINISVSTQDTMHRTTNRNQYYSDRTNAVQGIEKTMGELSQMFLRLSQMVMEQKHYIEKIDNNTDLSLKNVEAGYGELIQIKRDVSSNRSLLIKIFLILILTSVIYIIFFT